MQSAWISWANNGDRYLSPSASEPRFSGGRLRFTLGPREAIALAWRDMHGENLPAASLLPTGAVAGFTELSVPPQVGRAVSQEDTIVLKDHRGHRLGMLMKLANLQYLEEAAPGHPSVTTFNAEENRHMLDVNEAIGFVPVGYEGSWKKVL